MPTKTNDLNEHLPTDGPGRDDMMQLYSWTLEDAIKASKDWDDDVQGKAPIFRWVGAQQLKELYEIYQRGEKAAIVDALFVCSLNSLPIPRWCEMAFCAGYYKVTHYKAKSWDDVFERPHPKGTHLEAKRKEREKSPAVHGRIRDLREKDPSLAIDAGLFERVGKDLGICKTLAEEYYYKWDKIMNKYIKK